MYTIRENAVFRACLEKIHGDLSRVTAIIPSILPDVRVAAITRFPLTIEYGREKSFELPLVHLVWNRTGTGSCTILIGFMIRHLLEWMCKVAPITSDAYLGPYLSEHGKDLSHGKTAAPTSILFPATALWFYDKSEWINLKRPSGDSCALDFLQSYVVMDIKREFTVHMTSVKTLQFQTPFKQFFHVTLTRQVFFQQLVDLIDVVGHKKQVSFPSKIQKKSVEKNMQQTVRLPEVPQKTQEHPQKHVLLSKAIFQEFYVRIPMHDEPHLRHRLHCMYAQLQGFGGMGLRPLGLTHAHKLWRRKNIFAKSVTELISSKPDLSFSDLEHVYVEKFHVQELDVLEHLQKSCKKFHSCHSTVESEDDEVESTPSPEKDKSTPSATLETKLESNQEKDIAPEVQEPSSERNSLPVLALDSLEEFPPLMVDTSKADEFEQVDLATTQEKPPTEIPKEVETSRCIIQ